jgi:hypothetical protein
MRKATIVAALALAGALGACATQQQASQAKKEVDAVVIDEKARQAAADVARKTGESDDALKAGEAVSTREPATPKQ